MQAAFLISALVGLQAAGSSDRVDVGPELEPEVPAVSLAEYFPTGPFKGANKLVTQGRLSQGIAVLRRLIARHPDAPERPQASFLLALALLRVGEYDEAVQLFSALVDMYPSLREEHLFHKGQALYLWGSYVQAASTLSQVDEAGPRGPESQRLRAWALFRATDFGGLASWLEPLQALQGSAFDLELELVLGKARQRMGETRRAFQSFRRVWSQADNLRLASAALVEMAQLKPTRKRGFMSAVERATVLAHAKKLAQAKGDERVFADLEKRLARLAKKGRLRAEIATARGRIAEGSGRLRAALEHYARVEEVAAVGDALVRANAGLAMGRVRLSLGEHAKALETFEIVASRFEDLPASEAALFEASEILLRTRRYELAERRCQALLLKNPVSEFRRPCLWNSGWAHFRLGDFGRAQQFFESLVKMDLSADLDAASRYWLARTYQRQGQEERAIEGFREVIQTYPLSHYAAMAESQTLDAVPADAPEDDPAVDAPTIDGPVVDSPTGDGPTDGTSVVVAPAENAENAEKTEQTEKTDFPVGDPALPPEILQVQEYARLGLREKGKVLLLNFEKTRRAAHQRFDEPTLKIMTSLYTKLRLFGDARRLREESMRLFPKSLGAKDFVRVARRTHPIKFESDIRAAAAEAGISEALLFALVRTESGFKPNAVSPMHAYGLTQLILPTAQKVGKKLRAGPITRARLLANPRLNVRIGAAYLKSLLDRYDGMEPLAIAAYNAGPAAVDSWVRRRVRSAKAGTGEPAGAKIPPAPDELAEEIPVPETRAFVKSVLARARGYAILYATNDQERADNPRAADEGEGPNTVLRGPLTAPIQAPGGLRFSSEVSRE